MFYYGIIELGEGIDVSKSNNSNECTVCYYCY